MSHTEIHTSSTVCKNSTSSSSTGANKSLQIPYQWKRNVNSETFAVHYVTPSGHVLFSKEEVIRYLEKKNTCKCYLNLTLNYEDVFSFDPHIANIDSCGKTGESRCDDWSQSISHMIRNQILLTVSFIASHEVGDLRRVYEILHGFPPLDDDTFERWLCHFEWNKFRVLRDGRILCISATYEQLRHLTYELSVSGELNRAKSVIRTSSHSISGSSSSSSSSDNTNFAVNNNNINNTPLKSSCSSSSSSSLSSSLSLSSASSSALLDSPIKTSTSANCFTTNSHLLETNYNNNNYNNSNSSSFAINHAWTAAPPSSPHHHPHHHLHHHHHHAQCNAKGKNSIKNRQSCHSKACKANTATTTAATTTTTSSSSPSIRSPNMMIPASAASPTLHSIPGMPSLIPTSVSSMVSSVPISMTRPVSSARALPQYPVTGPSPTATTAASPVKIIMINQSANRSPASTSATSATSRGIIQGSGNANSPHNLTLVSSPPNQQQQQQQQHHVQSFTLNLNSAQFNNLFNAGKVATEQELNQILLSNQRIALSSSGPAAAATGGNSSIIGNNRASNTFPSPSSSSSSCFASQQLPQSQQQQQPQQQSAIERTNGAAVKRKNCSRRNTAKKASKLEATPLDNRIAVTINNNNNNNNHHHHHHHHENDNRNNNKKNRSMILTNRTQSYVAEVLDAPILTKQEDSGHNTLPRFESLRAKNRSIDFRRFITATATTTSAPTATTATTTTSNITTTAATTAASIDAERLQTNNFKYIQILKPIELPKTIPDVTAESQLPPPPPPPPPPPSSSISTLPPPPPPPPPQSSSSSSSSSQLVSTTATQVNHESVSISEQSIESDIEQNFQLPIFNFNSPQHVHTAFVDNIIDHDDDDHDDDDRFSFYSSNRPRTSATSASSQISGGRDSSSSSSVIVEAVQKVSAVTTDQSSSVIAEEKQTKDLSPETDRRTSSSSSTPNFDKQNDSSINNNNAVTRKDSEMDRGNFNEIEQQSNNITKPKSPTLVATSENLIENSERLEISKKSNSNSAIIDPIDDRADHERSPRSEIENSNAIETTTGNDEANFPISATKTAETTTATSTTTTTTADDHMIASPPFIEIDSSSLLQSENGLYYIDSGDEPHHHPRNPLIQLFTAHADDDDDDDDDDRDQVQDMVDHRNESIEQQLIEQNIVANFHHIELDHHHHHHNPNFDVELDDDEEEDAISSPAKDHSIDLAIGERKPEMTAEDIFRQITEFDPVKAQHQHNQQQQQKRKFRKRKSSGGGGGHIRRSPRNNKFAQFEFPISSEISSNNNNNNNNNNHNHNDMKSFLQLPPLLPQAQAEMKPMPLPLIERNREQNLRHDSIETRTRSGNQNQNQNNNNNNGFNNNNNSNNNNNNICSRTRRKGSFFDSHHRHGDFDDHHHHHHHHHQHHRICFTREFDENVEMDQNVMQETRRSSDSDSAANDADEWQDENEKTKMAPDDANDDAESKELQQIISEISTSESAINTSSDNNNNSSNSNVGDLSSIEEEEEEEESTKSQSSSVDSKNVSKVEEEEEEEEINLEQNGSSDNSFRSSSSPPRPIYSPIECLQDEKVVISSDLHEQMNECDSAQIEIRQSESSEIGAENSVPDEDHDDEDGDGHVDDEIEDGEKSTEIKPVDTLDDSQLDQIDDAEETENEEKAEEDEKEHEHDEEEEEVKQEHEVEEIKQEPDEEEEEEKMQTRNEREKVIENSDSGQGFLDVKDQKCEDDNEGDRSNSNRSNANDSIRSAGSSDSTDPDSDSLTHDIRVQKRMLRLKRELEFQGRPGESDKSDSDDEVLSPPLPPQKREFAAGDIVFGPRGEFRLWPAQVIGPESGSEPPPADDQVYVRWFSGKSANSSDPVGNSWVAIDNLKTLTEGLEEHRRTRMRHRSGKRVNLQLDAAIDEALGF